MDNQNGVVIAESFQELGLLMALHGPEQAERAEQNRRRVKRNRRSFSIPPAQTRQPHPETPDEERATCVARLIGELGRRPEFATKEDAENRLREMCRENLLVEAEEGLLKVRPEGQQYDVSPDAELEEAEKNQVEQTWAELLNRLYEAIKRDRLIRARNLRSQGRLSVAEFLGGKTGVFVVDTPTKEMFKADGTHDHWVSGGTLSVWSDGEKVWLRGAVGAIEPWLKNSIRLGVFLLLKAARESMPPYIPQLDKERERAVQRMWWLLMDGIQARTTVVSPTDNH